MADQLRKYAAVHYGVDPEDVTEDMLIDYEAERALNEYERKYGADGELAQERGVKAW